MFQSQLIFAQAEITSFFESRMDSYGPTVIADGMRYATTGGKRLRGFLALTAAEMLDVPRKQAIYSAAAIEALHAYSLVHDDLPCMDNDDLRRGQPTVHIKWNEATGVLVGDALQSLAFEILADIPGVDADIRADLVLSLARAGGANGMVLGQAQDIAAETAGTPLTLDQITELQGNKTGALLEWPAHAAALMARADPGPLRRYARALGLAFQIADDILDLEGDAKTAGKKLQKDAEAGKATFVSLLGLEGAKARAAQLTDEAIAAIGPYGDRAQSLKDLAQFVIARDR